MPYTPSHTWVAGDFIRASWLNLDTTNLADHETRLVSLEGGAVSLALDDLSDVTITAPVDEQVIKRSGGLWVNAEAPANINWRGAWNIATDYAADDMVEHDGSSWVATEATTGDTPGGGSPSPWDLVAAKGDTGATGDAGAQGEAGIQGPQGDPGLIGDWLDEWNSGTAYSALDAVQYQGSSYIANTTTTNEAPGTTSPDPWDLVAAKGDTGSAPTVIRSVGVTIDGAGSAISTGVKGFIRVPYTGTITKATLLSTDASATVGSIVIDVWKDTYANYPPTDADSITSAAPPTLSSANKAEDATLTGWTTAVTAGDVLGFNVDSASTVTKVTLILEVTT